MDEKLRITFVGMEPSETLKEYAFEKFSKHEHLTELITGADLVMTQHVRRRGVSQDFEITVNAEVPNSRVRVAENGEDMYALVDQVSDKLFRRLQRYLDKLQQWEGSQPWESVDVADADLDEDADMPASYADYVPQIVERTKMEYQSPMDEAEAIERMELAGLNQLMFKNNSTGKIAMVYKVGRGGYGIVEENDDEI